MLWESTIVDWDTERLTLQDGGFNKDIVLIIALLKN